MPDISADYQPKTSRHPFSLQDAGKKMYCEANFTVQQTLL